MPYLLSKRTAAKQKQKRIAIIGAGASGISAALALEKKGYTDLVLFEKETRIGGKSFSFEHKGRKFDLGSMTFSKDDDVATLAKKHGIRFEAVRASDLYLSKKKYMEPFEYILKNHSPLELFRAYLALAKLVQTTKIVEPGYRHYDAELYQPFASYIRGKNIEPLARAVEPVITGFGYGYYEEIPTIYALKFMASMFRIGLLAEWFTKQDTMCYFPDGWTTFWSKVTSHMDIRLGSDITEIKRTKKQIKIMVNGELERFDSLIITCPLPIVHEFLDITDAERALFSNVKSYRLVSSLVEGTKHPKTCFYVDNTKRHRIGHVIGFENYHPDSACYVTFQIVKPDTRPEDIRKMMTADARALGSSIKNVVTQKTWNYFYHVSPEELARGFYTRMNNLQGEKNTYYLGSVMNFETVSHCREFADFIVETHF